MVVMMIFTMMALGLNFVVGYAGLLDLGYVAFYAMGAYMSGWFASSQFATHRIHFGAVGITPAAPGFHFSIWLILVAAGLVDGVRRRAHRAADAAPARRLPRDRHARFRRDHPSDRAQRRRLLRHRLQPHRRHAGPDADRRPGLRQLDPHVHVGLPANYLFLQTADFYKAFYWTALLLVLIHRFLLDAPPRLAARARMDRDSRGRGRGCRDGRAAHAHEDVGVRDRRVLRRDRRRVLRELQVGDVSRATSSSTSPCSSSA